MNFISAFFDNPLQLITRLVVILFISLPVHECAHALVANRLGDVSEDNRRRRTLNPLAHIDIFGVIFMVFTGFGWAKQIGRAHV